MLPLRFPWFWMGMGWLLVIGVCVGSLIPGDMVPSVAAIGDKFVHAGSYFLLMAWFGGLYSRSRHVVIAATLLALGITLDVVQGNTATRAFDPRDIMANALGILLALALSFWLLEGWCQRLERRLFAVGT